MSEGYLSSLFPHLQADFERTGKEAEYFNDVALWSLEVLGLPLWEKQIEVAQALAVGAKKSVAVRAGHGVGKSFLAAIVACWWISTRPTQYVFVASTAPSADQVSAILWREIRRFHALSHRRFKDGLIDKPLPGYITMDNRWRDDVGNLIGQGRKPPDHNEDAFQGIHAQYVLAIGDEACGLNENMIDSLANITSNAKSRRFLIANPTNPRSRFGDLFLDTTEREIEVDGVKMMGTLQDAWSLHHISVLDSPNFHGGDWCKCAKHRGMPRGLGLDRQALESLTDLSYVEEKTLEYGKDSARFKARVLGEFAYDAGNNLFTDTEIAKARDAVAYIPSDVKPKVVLGVDVARSAHGDTSYVYSFTNGYMHDWVEKTDEDGSTNFVMGKVGTKQGGALRYVDSYRGVPITDTYDAQNVFQIGQVTLIHQHAINLGATEVRVDSGGMGVGVIDGLNLLRGNHYVVIEMQSGGPTPDGRHWYRNRDYQMDWMAKLFKAGKVDIDPADKVLITQLEDILFEFFGQHSAMKIESKDSMKKRGVKSPDAADAAWYACADLTYLTEGPKAGERKRESPADIVAKLEEKLVLSGFRDANPFL